MRPRAFRATIEQGLGLLAPPRCLACRLLVRAPLDQRLCGHCRRELGSTPALAAADGVDRIDAVATYSGAARGVVAALKSGAVPGAAETAAELCAERLGLPEAKVAIVPVPAHPLRSLRRGSDPAAALAAALAGRRGGEVAAVLSRRDRGRQRGRPRELRLADPPRVALRGAAPERALLVDDVVTTGATLTACARALRAGGSRRVEAVAFAAAGLSVERS